ncbi:MAG: DoxX family protein [Patescibacteria group bacterium]|nr:DoxX family protein [Patescibacteria group bacterium]MDE2438392.1 DoxX family protein [Patescibacteria group bacterium]
MTNLLLIKNYLMIAGLVRMYPLALLRLVISIIFVVHGLPKLSDLHKTKENFGMMGFRPGWLWGTGIALLEVVGGGALFFGLFSQFFALLFAIEMMVAMVTVKRKSGFIGGYEFDLLLFAACLVLVTQGGGFLSLDQLLLGL